MMCTSLVKKGTMNPKRSSTMAAYISFRSVYVSSKKLYVVNPRENETRIIVKLSAPYHIFIHTLRINTNNYRVLPYLKTTIPN